MSGPGAARKRMRIFFDARVLPPKAHHGIARHGLGLLRELFRDPGRHRFHVLAGSREAAGWLAGFPKKKDRFVIDYLDLKAYRIAEQYVLPRLLARLKPDLYYSPTFMPPVLTRTPVVFTIHDLTQIDLPQDHPLRRRLVWRFLIRPKAGHCRALLTVSGWAAERIAQWLNMERSGIRVIGNGLEEAFRPRSEEEVRAAVQRFGIEPPYFLLMGNPMPHKNLRSGTAAFQRLCLRGFKGSLAVVGARNMDLPQGPGRVIRVEGIGDDHLAALHTGALGTIFPSLAEGFGLPPLEAMACGTPVVVADLPVFREVLGEDTALLIPPSGEGTGPLAERMEYLAARPEEARAKAELNRTLVARHTWARAASRLREVFDRIGDGHDP